MSDEHLRLWGIGGNRTMRVHWMLAEFGLEYELQPIEPRTGETMTKEFLRLNPKHKIPVLEHGSLVLSESAAIINYLSDAFPAPEGFFVPKDTAGRTKLNEWCYFILMELDAASLYVIRRHGDLSYIYGEAPQAIESAKQYFSHNVDCMLQKFRGGASTLMPEGMTVADILLESCIDYALIYDIEIPLSLRDYRQWLMERPAYRRAFQFNYPNRSLVE
jgi:glutathione S-transferase